MEYGGRLRLSHHVVRGVFAPILVSTHEVSPTPPGAPKRIAVWVNNDHASRRVEGTLLLRLFSFGTTAPAQPLTELRVPMSIGPACSKEVWVGEALLGHALAHGQQPFLRLELVDTATSTPLAAPAHQWLVDWRTATLPLARITIAGVEALSDRRAGIRISADATAAFVTVECSSVVGVFSDAGFVLLAGEEHTLEFEARDAFELTAFQAGLHARSLRDTYVE